MKFRMRLLRFLQLGQKSLPGLLSVQRQGAGIYLAIQYGMGRSEQEEEGQGKTGFYLQHTGSQTATRRGGALVAERSGAPFTLHSSFAAQIPPFCYFGATLALLLLIIGDGLGIIANSCESGEGEYQA